MAFEKRYRAIVPIPRDQPVDGAVMVWLVRESFDRAAAADCLTIAEFVDLGTVSAADIPPKVDKQLGRPSTDFVWHRFEGVGRRADA